MKCTNCDKKVVRFINGIWNESVDYMFVRNHVTNLQKLETGLVERIGSSAYTCQCTFMSVEGPPQEVSVAKWCCGGH